MSGRRRRRGRPKIWATLSECRFFDPRSSIEQGGGRSIPSILVELHNIGSINFGRTIILMISGGGYGVCLIPPKPSSTFWCCCIFNISMLSPKTLLANFNKLVINNDYWKSGSHPASILSASVSYTELIPWLIKGFQEQQAVIQQQQSIIDKLNVSN